MAWSVSDLVSIVRDKFINTPLIDITTKITELEMVKLAIEALRAWKVRMNDVADIPQLYHLMLYHDDEYASKLIDGKSDQMQSAKATLFSLTGDCEDIHRLYEVTAIALGIPPQNSKLMVIFFGDEEKIEGGHATTLITKSSAYINLDYDVMITSNSIGGILSYHSMYGTPVAYVLLTPDPKSVVDNLIKYQEPKGFKASPSGRYTAVEIGETPQLRALKRHLHRDSEHEKKKFPWLIALGFLAGVLIGGVNS